MNLDFVVVDFITILCVFLFGFYFYLKKKKKKKKGTQRTVIGIQTLDLVLIRTLAVNLVSD